MKKKLLFVTLYLQTGGVERSLLSVLSSLNYDKYDVDLCLFDHSGVLFENIPPQVNVLPPIFEHYSTPLKKSIWPLLKSRKFKLVAAKLLAGCIARFTKGIGTGPRWAVYRHTLPKLKRHYDVAVSYLDFFCNYYVAEKVHADKKIVYNHMNYLDGQKSGWPCPKLERKAFTISDYIISVAESARESLVTYFPEIKNKIQVIHNTVSKAAIEALANEQSPLEYDPKQFNVLTVARLVEEKGIFLALEASKILKKQGLDFKWFFIGKGSLQAELVSKVKELNLQNFLVVLGEKQNPFPYIALCDVYVQPSKTEAHCVAVEEAMVLKRPIVVTDIPSFQDQVTDGLTGLIVKTDPQGIAEGIKKLYDSKELRGKLSNQLGKAEDRNTEELAKVLQLLDGNVAYSI